MLIVQVVTGFQRYANTSGYSYGFHFAGAYREKGPAVMAPYQQRETRMVAIDAKPFNRDRLEQYQELNIRRELNKAFVGFINK